MKRSSQQTVAERDAAVPVFVAEDDPYLQELTAMLLESAGVAFRIFTTGEEALAAFRQTPVKPRLIISDFSMGLHAINGLQFLAECKRLSPEIKAFLVSGTVEPHTINADGKPVDVFMPKPFNAEEYLRVVRTLLSQTDAHRAGPSSASLPPRA